jgi:hypothetical protein
MFDRYTAIDGPEALPEGALISRMLSDHAVLSG